MPAATVTVVVPVKPLARAKTRLALPADQRRGLALAFAVDTVEAVLASPLVSGVLVVTADPVVVDRLRPLPVVVVPDAGGGLGAAVRAGARAASTAHPAAGIAVVPADLPCLRAGDVTRVLTAGLTTDGLFVPDRSGTGTTMLVHPPGRVPVARYGVGSAARHRALGLRALVDAPDRARHDVDTLEDLRAAAVLGPGPRTSELTRRWQPTR